MTWIIRAPYNADLEAFNCYLPPVVKNNLLASVNICHIETQPTPMQHKDIQIGIVLNQDSNIFYSLTESKWNKNGQSIYLSNKIPFCNALVATFETLQERAFPYGKMSNIITLENELFHLEGMLANQEFVSNNKYLVELLCPRSGTIFEMSGEEFAEKYPKKSFVAGSSDKRSATAVQETLKTLLNNHYFKTTDKLWGFRFPDTVTAVEHSSFPKEVCGVGHPDPYPVIYQLDKLREFDELMRNAKDSGIDYAFALIVPNYYFNPQEIFNIFFYNSYFDFLDPTNNDKFESYVTQQIQEGLQSSMIISAYYGKQFEIQTYQNNPSQISLIMKVNTAETKKKTNTEKTKIYLVSPILKFTCSLKVKSKTAAKYFFAEGTFPLNQWIDQNELALQCYPKFVDSPLHIHNQNNSKYTICIINTLHFNYTTTTTNNDDDDDDNSTTTTTTDDGGAAAAAAAAAPRGGIRRRRRRSLRQAAGIAHHFIPPFKGMMMMMMMIGSGLGER